MVLVEGKVPYPWKNDINISIQRRKNLGSIGVL